MQTTQLSLPNVDLLTQVNTSSIAADPSRSNGSRQPDHWGPWGEWSEKLPSKVYRDRQLASGGGGRVPPRSGPVAAPDGDDMPDSFLARIRNMPDTFPARIKEAWLTKAGRWCIKATTPEGTVLKAMVPQWISDAAQELLKPGATAILPSKPPMGFREKEWTEVVSIIGPEPLPVETMPPATPASIPSPGQEGEGKDVTQVAYQAYRAFLDWLDG